MHQQNTADITHLRFYVSVYVIKQCATETAIKENLFSSRMLEVDQIQICNSISTLQLKMPFRQTISLDLLWAYKNTACATHNILKQWG